MQVAVTDQLKRVDYHENAIAQNETVIESLQDENRQLRSLEPVNTELKEENKKLRETLIKHFQQAVLQRAPVEDEDDDDEMPLAGPAPSVPQFFRFASTNETYVFENPQTDIPVNRFTTLQGSAQLAQYVDQRMESMGPVPSSQTLDATEMLEESLQVAQAILKQKKNLEAENTKLKSKAKRPKGKIIDTLESKLAGHDAMMKMVMKQSDKNHAKEIEDLKREHAVTVNKLSSEIERLKKAVHKGVNETMMRNAFDTKERALLKQIDELKNQKTGLEKSLKEERQLVQTNSNAHAKQKAELRQAKQDLQEFEAMKTRLVELETGIRNDTAVRDACAKLEVERQRFLKELRAEKDRATYYQQEVDKMRERLDEMERSRSLEQEKEDDDDEMETDRF